jgi:hypothetical protein
MNELNKDKQHISREKSKARELRKSQWWKNEISLGICHNCGLKFKLISEEKK